MALLAMIFVGLLGPSAHADTGVDWDRGLVTSTGVGLADRHAPNPAVARGPARRKAEDAAEAKLAIAVRTIPLAAGGTLADKLGDAKVKARLDRAIEGAIEVGAELETDGSWRITMAVPIEAVRQAIDGPRVLAANGDAGEVGPAVVIVEGVTVAPAVGYRIGGLAAPTLWVDKLPAWTKGAPRIKAVSAKAGTIDAPVGKATASTLFVIVVAKQP